MLSTAPSTPPTPPPGMPELSPLAVAAEQVAALAGRDAAAVEEGRRLTPELAAEIGESGFARHFVPRRWGGSAGTFTALLESAVQIAETCASAAWCATLYAAHGRLAAYLPEAGQRDLWADGPDVRIAASIVPPQGTAVAEGDGWRIDGQWSFASGIDHADWVLLASRPTGADPREHRIFAVPRADVTVLDTWHTLGLRGTGSNSVTCEGVHVPAHRSFTLADLLPAQPGAARCHQVPYPMVAALMFAAPVLGGARGALREWREATAVRRRVDGRPARETPSAQQVLARSSAQIEAARLLLLQAAQRADGGAVTPLSTAENQRDAAMAADLCVEAVDRLFRTSGIRGQMESDSLQRRWRDVGAAAGHAALGFEAASAAYAGAAYGGHA
ncbi:acyl-CoA dehydrogenase family protein [Streptomyces cinnamoneus]|uniref:Oxidoreductase mmfh n=1 Tax=Streptomyces cinnamoneus TaxID=53446 RepID=A0A918U1M6_STRCJ|nr:acyl-CoA dehydrogenase family protein [Streptomyces cinnamoneus]GHC70323.1 oxidoreductase mmfh [Streptomyces cinnamoneus]